MDDKKAEENGANIDDLKDVYYKQVRSVLEFGVPVWNCSLTKDDCSEIDRVQKAFMYIALENSYCVYNKALEKMQIETLETRRTQICVKFATKASKHPKHQTWFKTNEPVGQEVTNLTL